MDFKPELVSDIGLSLNDNSISIGSTAQYFKLTPSADLDTKWKISYLKTKGKKAEFIDVTDTFSDFKINFSSEVPSAINFIPSSSKQALLAKQEAIFVIDIEDCSENYDWRFYDQGIIVSVAENPYQYDLETQVINSGKSLLITISNVTTTSSQLIDEPESNCDLLGFRFTAIHLNKRGGGTLNQVFYSQDPRIVLNRV